MQASASDTNIQPAEPTECGRQVWAALVRATAALGIELTDVAVVHVEHKLWPDASLGIPEPGAAYVQALTPGFVVQMQAGDKTFTVHTGPGPTARLPGLPTAPEFSEDTPVVASAMLKLATTAGLRFSDVRLVDARLEAGPAAANRARLTVTLEAAGRRYVWTGPETGPLALRTDSLGHTEA